MRLVLLTACALLIAGCTTPAPESVPTTPVSPRTPVAEFSADQGGLEGIVTDDSLLPLEAVDFSLLQGNGFATLVGQALSDHEGRFAFSFLTPGSYLLEARHPAYGNASRFVEVVAGEVERVEMRLEGVQTTSPYVSLQIRNGLIACYMAFSVVGTLPCPLGTSRASFYFDVPADHRLVVLETDWAQRNVVLNMGVTLVDKRPDGTYTIGRPLEYVIGHPVLRTHYEPEQQGKAKNVFQPTPISFPKSDVPVSILLNAFYMGSYLWDETNSAASAYCTTTAAGSCPGVGVVTDHRYTNYVSAFIHGATTDKGAYSAIPDA